MNGRPPPAFAPTLPAIRPFGLLRALIHPDPDWRRLYAALAVSCLLHAAIVALPYLGTRNPEARPVARSAQNPAPARVLSVRLVSEGELAATVAATAAAAAGLRAANEEPRAAPEPSRGIELLPVPAPAYSYYTPDQLTKRPQATADPDLKVPGTAPKFGSGRVVLKLWINDRGNVVSVEVEKSGVPEEVAAAAAAAFGETRFFPGEVNGRPVGTLMRVEVSYDDGVAPMP